MKHYQQKTETLKVIYHKNKELYADLLDNPISVLFEHRKLKKKYNHLRRLTFRKPIK